MVRSRVLTFHIEPDHIDEVAQALDAAEERFAKNANFRGLICLDHPDHRHEIVVITMWDGTGLEDMEAEDEVARQEIADTCDLGVRSQEYRVLRQFAGVVPTPHSTSAYGVLLIDADEPERKLLRTSLEESCRFAVLGEADDGPTGTAMASSLHPDLVALDMSLPGGDAIGTLRRIQSASPTSKVVVVSGLGSDDLVHATVDILGAVSCLDKHIGEDRLVDEFINALEQPGQPYNTSPRAAIDRECVIGRRVSAGPPTTASATVFAEPTPCAPPSRPAGGPDIGSSYRSSTPGTESPSWPASRAGQVGSFASTGAAPYFRH